MRIVFPIILVFVGMTILLSPLLYAFGEMVMRAELIARQAPSSGLSAIGGTYILTLAIIGIVVMAIGIVAGLVAAGRDRLAGPLSQPRADGSAAD